MKVKNLLLHNFTTDDFLDFAKTLVTPQGASHLLASKWHALVLEMTQYEKDRNVEIHINENDTYVIDPVYGKIGLHRYANNAFGNLCNGRLFVEGKPTTNKQHVLHFLNLLTSANFLKWQV